MSEINDGGLAFPASRFEEVTYTNGDTKEAAVHYPGMTRRQWHAGHALAGILASEGEELTTTSGAARRAFGYADAMIDFEANEDASQDSKETCPDCGRLKAKNAGDAARGLCPKWWAIRDPMADRDCERAAALSNKDGQK